MIPRSPGGASPSSLSSSPASSVPGVGREGRPVADDVEAREDAHWGAMHAGRPAGLSATENLLGRVDSGDCKRERRA
eukprot:2128705-Pyramimonas_sp.AAC.1